MAEPTAAASQSALDLGVEPYLGNTDENQRFTIRRAREWCQRTANLFPRGWDLDASACAEAHHAPIWYGLDHPLPSHRNGLVAPWFGDTFFNCRWADILPWVEKAWRAWKTVTDPSLPPLTSITALLPGNRTHRDWWVKWIEPYRDGRRKHNGARLTVHFAPERFPYGGPGNPEGVGAPEPNFTSVMLLWRRA